jgi:two-component system CheB/CheR fusion protein
MSYRGARGVTDTSHAEFQRQLRSVFAILRAIVRRTSEGREMLEEFAAHLEGRIGALARVNEMLMRAPDTGVDLHELVCGELLAQAIPEARYSIEGPEIRLAREAAAPLALTLHELTTNAIVHGAFGVPHARANIAWECVEEEGRQWLRFEWIERGLALAGTAPAHKGFGFEVIERTLPYELGARASLTWSPGGAGAVLRIPAEGPAPNWRASGDD